MSGSSILHSLLTLGKNEFLKYSPLLEKVLNVFGSREDFRNGGRKPLQRIKNYTK